jgi:hypothetical protein
MHKKRGLRDKDGKRVYSGDYVFLDQTLVGVPNFIVKVTYHSRFFGWVGEKIEKGKDPCPQILQGLEHRITRIPKREWKKYGI